MYEHRLFQYFELVNNLAYFTYYTLTPYHSLGTYDISMKIPKHLADFWIIKVVILSFTHYLHLFREHYLLGTKRRRKKPSQAVGVWAPVCKSQI